MELGPQLTVDGLQLTAVGGWLGRLVGVEPKQLNPIFGHTHPRQARLECEEGQEGLHLNRRC